VPLDAVEVINYKYSFNPTSTIRILKVQKWSLLTTCSGAVLAAGLPSSAIYNNRYFHLKRQGSYKWWKIKSKDFSRTFVQVFKDLCGLIYHQVRLNHRLTLYQHINIKPALLQQVGLNTFLSQQICFCLRIWHFVFVDCFYVYLRNWGSISSARSMAGTLSFHLVMQNLCVSSHSYGRFSNSANIKWFQTNLASLVCRC